MLKAQELREKANEELEALLLDLKKACIEAVNEMRKTNKNEHPEQVKSKRRDIARILTVLRERELASQREGATS